MLVPVTLVTTLAAPGKSQSPPASPLSPEPRRGPSGLDEEQMGAAGFAVQLPYSTHLSCTDYISVDTDTVETVVLPDSMVGGGERLPDHQLITQEEPADVPAPPAVAWRALIVCRVLAAAAALAVLLVGVLVRLQTAHS